MSTEASSSVCNTSGEKSETSLRRSLRVAGLPAEVVSQEAEKSKSKRSTSEAPDLSAEAEASREAEPSAESETPPKPGNVVPPPDSPETKRSGTDQGGGAGTQPSARVDEGLSQGVPAESKTEASLSESKAQTKDSQLPSAHPEPTAAIRRSSQVEGGALSLLGSQ
ncbi:uncharacterized protein IUM83_06755 [Phytophthora cinnamomi]|uniref:uncharacterized protein n=1 Tax=Phytophthora cinnamomi TaxID=4785 RepID=UPI00355A7138|nr:hypothetical protein IUM83_06755 [Phytophthora cinnamomi]